MKKETITIPKVAETITEVMISRWLCNHQDIVRKDQEVVEVDTDKTSLTLVSPVTGRIYILVQEGSQVQVGQVIAEIEVLENQEFDYSQTIDTSKPVEKATTSEMLASASESTQQDAHTKQTTTEPVHQTNQFRVHITPLAKQMIEMHNLSVEDVIRFKISSGDVQAYLANADKTEQPSAEQQVIRKRMTPLRKKIAQRLVSVKNQTAMLTTFNEVDMSELLKIRNQKREAFLQRHGVKLNFVSFFARACALAMKDFPEVNAMIEGDDIVYHSYVHIGIAVSTDKGLVVPVVRHVEQKTIAQIEKDIHHLASRARQGKLEPSDLEGGTFSITNGGVFGSLFATPIINPPQTAILGMHAIQERPVVRDGQIVIRPMMYVALSYDHRLIDGKESVGFLMKVKYLIENPMILLVGGEDVIDKTLEL